MNLPQFKQWLNEDLHADFRLRHWFIEQSSLSRNIACNFAGTGHVGETTVSVRGPRGELMWGPGTIDPVMSIKKSLQHHITGVAQWPIWAMQVFFRGRELLWLDPLPA